MHAMTLASGRSLGQHGACRLRHRPPQVSAFLSDAGGTATEGAEAEGTPDASGGGEAPAGAGAADGGAGQGASGGEQQPSLRKGSRS